MAAYTAWNTAIGATDTLARATSLPCNWLYIRNPTGNATIFIKPAGGAVGAGIELAAGAVYTFSPPTQGANAHNPSELAIQGTQSNVVQFFSFTL